MLRTLRVKKVSAKIGNRPIGSRFSEDEKRAKIWVKLGLVEDVSKDLKPMSRGTFTEKVFGEDIPKNGKKK